MSYTVTAEQQATFQKDGVVKLPGVIDAGLLDGSVMTVTGKTLAENLEDTPTLDQLGEQDIVFPVDAPIAAGRPNPIVPNPPEVI